jgi:hypothetical protein
MPTGLRAHTSPGPPPLRRRRAPFTIKHNKDGNIRKFKARWVVRGFDQRAGLDFDKEKLYAPVINFTHVRTAFSLAAQWRWRVHQLDVVAAFLYAEIKEDMYISLSEGYKENNVDGIELYGRLSRALYGTKQVVFGWRQNFDGFLRDKV